MSMSEKVLGVESRWLMGRVMSREFLDGIRGYLQLVAPERADELVAAIRGRAEEFAEADKDLVVDEPSTRALALGAVAGGLSTHSASYRTRNTSDCRRHGRVRGRRRTGRAGQANPGAPPPGGRAQAAQRSVQELVALASAGNVFEIRSSRIAVRRARPPVAPRRPSTRTTSRGASSNTSKSARRARPARSPSA
jgi:hypothetical protein